MPAQGAQSGHSWESWNHNLKNLRECVDIWRNLSKMYRLEHVWICLLYIYMFLSTFFRASCDFPRSCACTPPAVFICILWYLYSCIEKYILYSLIFVFLYWKVYIVFFDICIHVFIVYCILYWFTCFYCLLYTLTLGINNDENQCYENIL